MSSQPTFDFTTPRAEKRVTETSAQSYRQVKPNLNGKYLLVLTGLESYLRWKEHEPTARELMEYMTITDPNEVRPRLSEMKDPDEGLHFVEASTFPRKCKVTGKTVHTWNLTPRGRAFIGGQK